MTQAPVEAAAGERTHRLPADLRARRAGRGAPVTHAVSRWIRGALFGAVVAGLAAAGCGDRQGKDIPRVDADTVPEEARYGGTVVVAGMSDLHSMNSLTSSDYYTLQHQVYVLFTTLVRHGPGFVEEPFLARSWEVNADTTEVLFHLRDDVRWHDGTPVTAADVAFTFDRAKDPEVPFANRSYFDRWEVAEVVDEHRIRFLIRPHGDFLYGWAVTAIMPRHILGGVPPGRLQGHPFGTSSPVGSGPFRFVERVPGERWVFEANPDFPAGLGGRPYLDRLVYRVIPEETAALAELSSGRVDLYVDVAPDRLPRLAAHPSLATVDFPSPTYSFIAWNSLRPYFASPELRRALTMAIDREELLRAVRGGLGTPAAGPVGPWHPAFDPTWRPLPYAPDSAAAILDRAGWRDRDGDGVREREGIRFSFELMTNEMKERRDIAVVVQAALARVGVEAIPRVRESAALRDAVTSPDRRYDAAVLAWVRDVFLNDRDLWACDQLGQPLQFTSYCNPELDPVLDSIPLTVDRERRKDLIRHYHEIIATDQPYTFLYFEKRADALRRVLRGFEPDARGDWASVSRWWLMPDERRGAAR
ncbi:MAG: ABC transporter substrate-binding protein [Gemmatimonadota bacterium]